MNFKNGCWWISSMWILLLLVNIIDARGGGRSSGRSSGGRSGSSGSSRSASSSSSSSSSHSGSSFSGSSYGSSSYAGSSSGYYSGGSSGVGSSIGSSRIGSASYGLESPNSHYGISSNLEYRRGPIHTDIENVRYGYVPTYHISQANAAPRYPIDNPSALNSFGYLNMINLERSARNHAPYASYYHHSVDGVAASNNDNENVTTVTPSPNDNKNYIHFDHEQKMRETAKKLFGDKYNSVYGLPNSRPTENSVDQPTTITVIPSIIIEAPTTIINDEEYETDLMQTTTDSDIITTTIEINPTNLTLIEEDTTENIFNTTENNIYLNETNEDNLHLFTNETDVTDDVVTDDNDDATTDHIIAINKTINMVKQERQMLVENSANNFLIMNRNSFVMISLLFGLSLSLYI